MTEIWKTIDGYPRYMVSNFGVVKSYVGGDGKILSQSKNGNGYLSVCLCRPGFKPLRKSIHRLVALHFLPQNETLGEINHKDGCKENNVVDNLEFSTRSHNIKHAYSLGLKMPVRLNGESCSKSKLKNGDVLKIRQLSVDGVSQELLSKMFNTHKTNINYIVNRKTWKHI